MSEGHDERRPGGDGEATTGTPATGRSGRRRSRLLIAALAALCLLGLWLLLAKQAGWLERPNAARDAQAPAGTGSPAAPGVAESGEIEQRFDFYSELPESAPDGPGGEHAPPPGLPAPPAVSPDGRYLLVAGYYSLAEAVKLRDKLEFMRLDVTLTQSADSAGQVYYHLLLGPYTDPDEQARVRMRLRRRGIESTPQPGP